MQARKAQVDAIPNDPSTRLRRSDKAKRRKIDCDGARNRSSGPAKLGFERNHEYPGRSTNSRGCELTRNLKPLEKGKLLRTAVSSDRRERLLRLSPEGARRLKQSYVLWEKTQQRFTTKLGEEAFEVLEQMLRNAELAADAVMKDDV